jgi:oligoribonuclease
MGPFVRDMHTKNGLIKRVRSSQKTIEEAEIQLLTVLSGLVPFRRGILVGNSIYMDRRFLKRYMPTFESFLHYRQIDVSSLKIACQEWYPDEPKHQKPPAAHTALEDIRESIAELKYYKGKYFKELV